MHKYDRTYKYFIKLRREWTKLHEERKAMPYVDVEPFQRGWICNVVAKPQYLTQDGLIDVINIGYSYRYIKYVSDVKNIRKGITHIRLGKFEENYFPQRKRISIDQYNKFSMNIKKWFTEQTSEKTLRKYYYVTIPDNWLKLKVKPNIYTKVQKINPQIESRITEINEIFEQNCYWGMYSNYNGWRNYNINIRQNFKQQLHKFKLDQIDSIENDSFKLGWS